MDNYISRAEHNEFVKRMEEEHHRINKRLVAQEQLSEQNNKLLISVEKLALNMETMQKEQKEQGERLEILESRDGEKWRNVIDTVIKTLIGIVVGFIFAQIGM